MSLPEAILEIADDMENTAKEAEDCGEVADDLKSFAKQLRRAVKAATPDKQIITQASIGNIEDYAGTLIRQNSPDTLQAREEATKARLKAQAQENLEQRMVEAVGGCAEGGTYVQTPPNMPVGAFTFVGKQVFQFQQDGKLHYHEEQTKRAREQPPA